MRAALITLATLVVAVLLDIGTRRLVRRADHGRYRWVLGPLRKACRRPTAVVLLLTGLYLALPPRSTGWLGDVRHVVGLLLIGGVAWLVIKALHVAEGVTFSRLPPEVVADRRIRRARTQIRPSGASPR